MSKPTSLLRIDTKWESCPNCDDDMIEGGPFSSEGDWVWQRVTCTECHTTWVETYTALERTDIIYPEEVDSTQPSH